MRRALSLHVWLAFALALAIAVPALAGLAAWAAAGQWQAGREAHRRDQAVAVLPTAQLDTPAQRDAVSRRLAALGVEAQLGPSMPDKAAIDAKAAVDAKAAKDIAAKAALAGKPVVIVVLLRRWVLQPLARLAADAEHIAGGELDVEPLPTRAREVARVGDALHGMARGLSDALRTSTASSATCSPSAGWSTRATRSSSRSSTSARSPAARPRTPSRSRRRADARCRSAAWRPGSQCAAIPTRCCAC